MMFMHDNPAALDVPKSDGQSKVQRCPLHLLVWVHALHMRKSKRDIIPCNNLQPLDIECNWVRLARIRQFPSIFVGSEPATGTAAAHRTFESRANGSRVSLACSSHGPQPPIARADPLPRFRSS